MIQIQHVSKSFRGIQVLKDISLELNGGECIALLGPNGAGKTTLLQMVSGAIPATSGSIVVDEISMQTFPQKAKLQLGVAPQAMGYFPYLTARENLYFVGKLRGMEDPAGRLQQEDLLRRFELTHAANRVAKEYSEGMRQKLNIAMAMMGSPPNLILDESLNGLDPRGLATAKELIQERIQEGALVLMTSHILPLVEELATRIILLHEGEVKRDLSTDELASMQSRGDSLEGQYLAWTNPTEHS